MKPRAVIVFVLLVGLAQAKVDNPPDCLYSPGNVDKCCDLKSDKCPGSSLVCKGCSGKKCNNNNCDTCDFFGVSSPNCFHYHQCSDCALQTQIKYELLASDLYLAFSAYFDRADVALPGISNFFLKASEEQREHGEKIIKYVNKRGGQVHIQPRDLTEACKMIHSFTCNNEMTYFQLCHFLTNCTCSKKDLSGDLTNKWPLIAMEESLALEKFVFNNLIKMHGLISRSNSNEKCPCVKDPQLSHFLEREFLDKQIETIKELADYVTQLMKFNGNTVGLYLFDLNMKRSKD